MKRGRKGAPKTVPTGTARRRLVPAPRPLRGLGTLHVALYHVLVRSQRRQGALAAAKRIALRVRAEGAGRSKKVETLAERRSSEQT